ncbi:MAG: hypothetical protein HQ579_06050 [Candidatus Omnitrophica bacterium]|nr:hypothetical protein [Candidatus Omnitrophota bacterium]
MCGIIGYTGKRNAKEILLRGLTRLEYRGYDSAGIAILENGRLNALLSGNKFGAARGSCKTENKKGGNARWRQP